MLSNHKRLSIATLLLSAVFAASQAEAQRVADIKGFHIGGGLNATSIKLDETEFSDDERENGYGLNINAGYNFTNMFGVTLALTAASIDDQGTDDYTLAHVDLGGRVSFPGRSALVPYLELALVGVSGKYDDESPTSGEVEFEGGGIGFGGGLNWFFGRKTALDLNFRYTVGEFDEVEINEREVDVGDGLGFNTTRLNLGISFYP